MAALVKINKFFINIFINNLLTKLIFYTLRVKVVFSISISMILNEKVNQMLLVYKNDFALISNDIIAIRDCALHNSNCPDWWCCKQYLTQFAEYARQSADSNIFLVCAGVSPYQKIRIAKVMQQGYVYCKKHCCHQPGAGVFLSRVESVLNSINAATAHRVSAI
jgi:hypothetical protein